MGRNHTDLGGNKAELFCQETMENDCVVGIR